MYITKTVEKMKSLKRMLSLVALAMISMAAFAQLPSIQLNDIDGNAVNTAELSNDGKPFVISFFATWCKPCNRELDAIQEQYEDWQEETGVKVFAVSIDQGQNINKVKPMVDQKGWDFTILLEPNSEFKNALGIQMIPHLLILDGEGNIVKRHPSYIDGGEEEVIKEVREILEKK